MGLTPRVPPGGLYSLNAILTKAVRAMNWKRRFLILAVCHLLGAASLCPAFASGRLARASSAPDTSSTSLRFAAAHARTSAWDGPDLRSSSVLILDATHASVLY